jgi:Domain of unknown function (DUF4157)
MGGLYLMRSQLKKADVSSRSSPAAASDVRASLQPVPLGNGALSRLLDPRSLESTLGPGRTLTGLERARMEASFAASFANVRLHTDGRAAALVRQLGARAFTLGRDVAFESGGYAPGTPAGDALLAHELAHVVQQREAIPSSDAHQRPDTRWLSG